MATNTPTVAQPAQNVNAQSGQVPFSISSRIATRDSFTDTKTLSAAAPVSVSPIQIPAVGFIKHLWLHVKLAATGGTSPAFAADGPFGSIASISFKTAAGNDIIVPVTGYELFLINKYGGFSEVSDPRNGISYNVSGASAEFFLRLDFEFDAETGLGSIPALASNRSYQLFLTWAAISSFATGAPAITATVTATAEFWFEPPQQSATGLTQAVSPQGIGTLSQWQMDMAPMTPGDKYVKLNNVGSVLRNVILIVRNASGARIDTNGLGDVAQLYLDNNLLFHLPKNLWQEKMRRWYNLNATTKDVANGLDTGVYVIPFHALTGSIAGETANSRSQLLPTLDSSLVQVRSSWGSAVSTLQILTQNIIPAAGASLFGK